MEYGIPFNIEFDSSFLYSSIIVTNELYSSWYLWALIFASLNNSKLVTLDSSKSFL
jgi:hypothetical protein